MNNRVSNKNNSNQSRVSNSRVNNRNNTVEYVRPRLFTAGSIVGRILMPKEINAVINKAKRNGGKIGVAVNIYDHEVYRRPGGRTVGYAFFELQKNNGLLKIHTNFLKDGDNLKKYDYRYGLEGPHHNSNFRMGSVKAGQNLFLKEKIKQN